ncbi:APHP domain protein [Methanolacinia petrolearia DSM 11571]|uniref:APHP domain protein n=1 Tax=Methanolacinia petrolearia (strain DSM 11571 / OCM 486 / SEBR 4847) TaxID=679926 RepID=E1RDB7_METP4|nr:APHP domain protein [Methanolacinia petrolearia DSM 11571]
MALCLALICLFFVTPGLALYDFEGIPLDIASQGEVAGSIYSAGTYGLTEPPVACSFTLPGEPVWAEVYTGVWGGTEKYSGTAEISINSLKIFKYSLYGEQDMNENVYCTGHGVYWISQDATDLLHSGENRVVVNTSRGESGSRMDGRVYAVFVVAAVGDNSGYITQYWIAEGNENLHGEGWSGSNPTVHDTSSYTFSGADLTGMQSAELTTVLLAGTRYQPDYMTFNSNDLGQPETDTSHYPEGATDIGDEICFDAEGGSGTESRYVDVESFDVTDYVKDVNTVVFERGRDSNGDGVIDPSSAISEGEDYIHPCLAVLSVKKKKASLLQDMGIAGITTANMYAGATGTLTAEVRNYGENTGSQAVVAFYVDGEKIGTATADTGSSGVGYAVIEWAATGGEHEISAKLESPADSVSSNDEYSLACNIEDLPDLSLKVSSPVSAESGEAAVKQSPSFFMIPVLGAAGAAAVWGRRKKPGKIMAATLVCMLVLCPVLVQPSFAAGLEYREYVLPVEVLNEGGAVDPGVSLTVYLDGEKAAYTTLEDGIDGGDSESVEISIFTTPGSHKVRIVVDEEGSVDELDEGNNSFEAVYEFP